MKQIKTDKEYARHLACLLFSESKKDGFLRSQISDIYDAVCNGSTWEEQLPSLIVLAQVNNIVWGDSVPVFEAEARGEIPEHVDLMFTTTELRGGDAGHGADATLRISLDNGSRHCQLLGAGGEIVATEKFTDIVLTVCGDWEITGLAQSIVDLGKKLEPLVRERKLKHRDSDILHISTENLLRLGDGENQNEP